MAANPPPPALAGDNTETCEYARYNDAHLLVNSIHPPAPPTSPPTPPPMDMDRGGSRADATRWTSMPFPSNCCCCCCCFRGGRGLGLLTSEAAAGARCTGDDDGTTDGAFLLLLEFDDADDDDDGCQARCIRSHVLRTSTCVSRLSRDEEEDGVGTTVAG